MSDKNNSAAGAAPGPSTAGPLTASQVDTLVRLADAATDEWADSGGDSELFHVLKDLALIVPIEGGYNPDKHEGPYTDFLDPGDDYFTAVPWLQAAIARLRDSETESPADERDGSGSPKGA